MKKHILWAGGLVLALAVGYLLGAAPWRAEAASTQQAQVRIYDQNVEWFDGTQWHTVASVKDLQESDPLGQAQNTAGGGQGQVFDRPIGSVTGEDGGTGQDPSTKKQTGDGGTTKTGPDKPKTNTNTNTNTAKPNTQPGNPGATEKPKPTAKPTAKPSKPGGDGEDVEWSDDFL